MRRDAVAADRAFVVREAAEAWRKAGAIDEATERTIDASYPDDRRRLGLGLRILACVTTLAGGAAAVVLLNAIVDGADAAVWAVAALLFVWVTELQMGRWRRAQAGAEYATGLLGAFFLCLFFGEIGDFRLTWETYALFAILWTVAAWRWGFAFFAVVAMLLLLLGFADGHHARAGTVVIGVASLATLLATPRWIRLAPSHRRALDWAATLGVAAAYAAGNIYVLDTIGLRPLHVHVPAPGWARVIAILATALVPPGLLALGILRRHRTLLLLGALTTAASLATIRSYVRVAPLWIVLAASGAACAGLAIGLKRWLGRGPSKARRGFTAEPLYGDRRLLALAQGLATVAALSPRPGASAEKPTFEGGGGLSGGGGAQGRF